MTRVVALGGVDTLLQHPAGLTYRPVAAAAKPQATMLCVPTRFENPEDILADLIQTIEADCQWPLYAQGSAGVLRIKLPCSAVRTAGLECCAWTADSSFMRTAGVRGLRSLSTGAVPAPWRCA